ncbi:phosphotransferase enzyme family protein [Paractinoplanes toevensis]|uniref:Trifolitoxin immunity domain-containing protein n=1 Tax=Paractinoplanes toevensis TaxID=571911 RepID=A0A919W353_9ACTN|nr:phosphotransferase [Actinoplanes toevensis]GIM94382.1 trifolitoxin immunity domain-containing protein [Actinoplanes toevensis]
MTEAMDRGRFSKPVRNGDVVERVLGPGRSNVHALLEHLHERGFDLAPRFLGVTSDGSRERLSFLSGDTGYPPLAAALRSDAALVDVARAARKLHDASEGFVAPEPGRWSGHDYAGPVRPDCVGHLDLAPWNITFDGEQVTGIIDWDFAAPTSRMWDLAYAAHQFVPLHPSEALAAWGWDTEPDRVARLRMFAQAYGEPATPAELVDLAAMRLLSIGAHIEDRIRAGDPAFAVHRDEDHGSGYRTAAAWILTHRAELLG